MLKSAFFEMFNGDVPGDVPGGSVCRAAVFHTKVSGSNLTLVTFFSFLFFLFFLYYVTIFFFLLFDTSNSLISFKVNKYNYVTMEFCLLNSIAQLTTVAICMC